MRKVDNLPQSCAVVTKYGDLNFLEPSGPVQACNGTALPFYHMVLLWKETKNFVSLIIFEGILVIQIFMRFPQFFRSY